MGNRFGKRDDAKMMQRLVLENIRRVFFASLVCVFVTPVLLIIEKFSNNAELAGEMKGALIAFEIISALSAALSVYSFKKKDIRLSTLGYRVFWLVFELVSALIIFANAIRGNSLTFYPIMLGVLAFVPVLSNMEMMYYMVVQLLFILVLNIKMGTNGTEIFNVVFMNVLFIGLSRLMLVRFKEHSAIKNRIYEESNQASIDQLTGLLNKRGFDQRVYAALPELIRTRQRASMLYIDIDDMQRYNDSFGSECGDDCIRTLGEFVRQVGIRKTDIICRMDGGRFLLFMEGGTDKDPAILAEKMRSFIEMKRIPHGKRASNQFVTVSIGVASCVPRSMHAGSELYDEAEEALFDAKERGKNITIYEAQIYGQYARRAN